METLDPDACYRASVGRDPRWDGRVYIAVVTTGVYCRPSCPARKPFQRNCRFYPTAAAAVTAGFRACRRCRPEALPGSRHWDVRGDLAARAVRMIRDGVIDEVGVGGLAERLSVSERHLHRVLVAELGAAPQQLNRTRRAQLARMLIEQTPMIMADVAFAAGFASVRQFNDVIREEFGDTPSRLRHSRPDPEQGASPASGSRSTVVLRLRHRAPLALGPLRAFLAQHAVPGLEHITAAGEHTRTVPARHGTAIVTLGLGTTAGPEHITARLQLADLADLAAVVGRVRRWLDLDADAELIDEALGDEPLLRPLVRARPGLRVPGAIDGFETSLLALLIGVRPSRPMLTAATRLVRTFGDPATDGLMTFPTATTLADAEPIDLEGSLGISGPLAHHLHALAAAVSEGLVLGPGADRDVTRQTLQSLPGVDQHMIDYVALRVLGDPDAFPWGEADADRLLGTAAGTLPHRAHQWRPWRGYALMHLWCRAQSDSASGLPQQG